MRCVLAAASLLLVAGCGAASHHPVATEDRTPSAPSSLRTEGARQPPFTPHRMSATTLAWKLSAPSARQALVDTGSGPVLLAGGMLPGDVSTPRSFRIDLSTGHTQELSPLAVPVHDAAGGAYAGRPAVYGGGNSTEQSLVQAYRGGRWRKVDSLPTTRSDLTVAQVDGRTFVLGGYDGAHVPVSVLSQRGGGRIESAGRLRVGVRYAAAATVGPAVFLFGGEVSGHELGTIQRYDTRTGRTREVGRLRHPLGHAMAATFGTRVLLMGGRTDPNTQTTQAWWFDPATGQVSRAGRLPRALSDAAVARRGANAYLLGGEDPTVTERVVRVSVR